MGDALSCGDKNWREKIPVTKENLTHDSRLMHGPDRELVSLILVRYMTVLLKFFETHSAGANPDHYSQCEMDRKHSHRLPDDDTWPALTLTPTTLMPSIDLQKSGVLALSLCI